MVEKTNSPPTIRTAFPGRQAVPSEMDSGHDQHQAGVEERCFLVDFFLLHDHKKECPSASVFIIVFLSDVDTRSRFVDRALGPQKDFSCPQSWISMAHGC